MDRPTDAGLDHDQGSTRPGSRLGHGGRRAGHLVDLDLGRPKPDPGPELPAVRRHSARPDLATGRQVQPRGARVQCPGEREHESRRHHLQSHRPGLHRRRSAALGDKGAIGYYGVPDANGIYQTLDASRPIYDKAHYYVDLFIRYQLKLFGGRVPTSLQFNVKNLGDKVRLQPIGANPDGSIDSYRIMDPAQYIFTVTFDL